MKTALLLFLLLLSLSGFTQQVNWCGTNHLIQQQIEANPAYQQELHEFFIKSGKGVSNSEEKGAALIVPVVVHVIHDNGNGNISDDQIESALLVMNIDYNRQNADTLETRNTASAPFQAIAGGMDIEFKLAKIDPWGNCTNGIVRVNAPHLTYDAGEDCKFDSNGGSSAWPSDQYFNIWVVNSIDNGGEQGIIAGYAYYPNNISGNPGYGILMDDNYMGTIGTAASEDGRVLTHEMGHALGLPHIFDEGWGGTTGCHSADCYSNGDYVCDTPPQTEANWSCSPIWNSCNLVPVNDAFGFDALDQIENYMSYNSCQNMFSLGQVAVMEDNFVNVPELANMVTPANIVATGVTDPDQLCKAEFEAYKTIVCTGSVVGFLDYSFTDPTSWQWTLSPGVEGTDYLFVNGSVSTDQNPTIEFITPGDYDVSLTVSDGATFQSETKTGYIKVLPNTGTLPILEGFEPYSDFDLTDNWIVSSSQANNQFEVTSGVSHSGNKSAGLLNFGQSAGNVDELLSSTVDLSWLDPLNDDVTLSFRYAYRKRHSGNDEWLKVFLTSNCGESWVQRKTIHGAVLSPNTYPAAWTPTSLNDWTTVHMTNVTSSFWTDNFRYKFRFESDGGNNFFLDNINIYQGAPSEDLVAVDEPKGNNGALGVFPNPAAQEVNIELFLDHNSAVELQLLDISGKLIRTNHIQGAAGRNLIVMNIETLSSGTYLLQVKTDSGIVTEKLIRN